MLFHLGVELLELGARGSLFDSECRQFLLILHRKFSITAFARLLLCGQKIVVGGLPVLALYVEHAYPLCKLLIVSANRL